ncbi:GOLPH3/VPS74 family protein [Plantactinospora sp. KLBMP9567]|uniref:GOLPH3/VPS74 family protein n=1 Tax=Plantactinospora sp. KLBMP9567 TaxID=3085900 RepID=UPI0029822CAA|nr:GPP34 family phosphoprotein [Plantactinospora sp. KLBMP9567]MDW5325350.1 GPP34 family phosphoprotein [Plantactinospora sp. KLBMP9567]
MSGDLSIVSIPLKGTLVVLADDYFRLAHHDVDGRPRLHHRAVEIGLAAALLGELLSTRHIEVHDGHLVVVNRTPPVDALSHTVLDSLLAESHRQTVRTWLLFLSQAARTQVASRLIRHGHLRAETSRRLFGPPTTTYLPTDMNQAAWPWLSLSMRLRDGQQLSYEMTCLAGLALATGLDRWLLAGASSASVAYLREVVTHTWKPMRELLVHTEATIGDAVLAHRT